MKDVILIENKQLEIVGACGMKIHEYNNLRPENRHMEHGQCFAFIKNTIRDGWHVVNFPKKIQQKPQVAQTA